MSVTEDGFYGHGTSDGILKQPFAISQFTLCPKKCLRIEDILNYKILFRLIAIGKFT